MSVIQPSLGAVTLLSSLLCCHLSYAGCQPVNDLNFALDVASMLPQTATATTMGTSSQQIYPLQSCTDLARFSIQYQLGQTSDLSTQAIDLNGRRFYKIRSMQGVSTGNAALTYLVAHAYVAFSLNSRNEMVQVNVTQADDRLILVAQAETENTNSWVSVPVSLSETQLYFDALPNNDEIIEQLTTQQIHLKVGQLNIELWEKDSNEAWSPSISPSSNLDISGIQFQRATCFVKDQTVLMEDLSVSAFHQAGPMLAGNSQAFALDVQCDGYLNQRTINLTWKDNNWSENINRFGYLSSVKANGYSNVGIQIRDEFNQPIVIGERYEFADTIQGNATSKRYVAQYLLMDSKAFVGRVNAQATIQIDYR